MKTDPLFFSPVLTNVNRAVKTGKAWVPVVSSYSNVLYYSTTQYAVDLHLHLNPELSLDQMDAIIDLFIK
jgi:hypothetical protein